jgi:hypothetical protein
VNSIARRIVGVFVVALASLACGSGSASAASEQDMSALGALLKKLAAKQVFTGTIVVTDSASGASAHKDIIQTASSNTTLNHNVVFTVTTGGNVVAKITYAQTELVQSKADYQDHTVTGSKTTETTASGTVSDPGASVTVDLRSDNTYQINFSAGGVEGVYKMSDIGTTTCKKLEGSTCRPGSTANKEEGKTPDQGGLGGSVDGKIDPSKPNVLAGSVSQAHTLNDGSVGRRTVTWNLSRQP